MDVELAVGGTNYLDTRASLSAIGRFASNIKVFRFDVDIQGAINWTGDRVMSMSEEIGLLEKTVHELVRRPSLIRSAYWTEHVECFLTRSGLRIVDQKRLVALLELLGATEPASL
jgi:HAMP domain-containing protein